MAALSDFLENKLIDHILRGQPYTAPTTVYVALFTAPPTDAAGGTEVSGGGYARVAIASSLANWAGTQGAGTVTSSTGTSGTTSNNAVITFPQSSASWGTIVGFGIFDALTGGNMLIFGGLTASVAVPSGVTASFAAGQLSFQIDN